MTSYERFKAMYEHREADHVPVMDEAWWDTVRRWQSEGMPTDDWVGYFGLDRTASIGTDNSPRLPVVTVEETDEYIIQTTSWGAKRKNFKTHNSTPEALGFKVRTPDDWAKVKPRMTPADDRIPWQMLRDNYKQWRAEGRWITGDLWFGFDITHSGMVGTDNLLMNMVDEPEWVMDMFETELDLSLQLIERVWDAGYTFDELRWWDDMGYKGTQFFSMNMYREMLKPYHQRAIDWAHSHGIVAHLHSCGNIMPFVPELVGMGLDGLNPLEVKAGMRPAELKQKYGDKLLFHGGTNAAIWHKPEIIIPQIEELVPMMKQGGGYIFASDHSIPSSVSFKDMQGIMDAVRRVGKY